ncbi:hypothetical protein KDA00_05760 [Candidatus Saccharibacteria bacterium]|nr:hypothetical protein [Candidatus Saccharibacteria bacterium]
MTKHIIIYSHGFGVRKDDRGLFTDIAKAFPDAEHVMFDFNEFDVQTNTLTARPLDEQASMLNQQIESIKQNYPYATIDIIAHSQGCVATSIAKPEGIRKAILLAPPAQFLGLEKKEIYSMRPDTVTDEDGTIHMPRRDGSTTTIKEDYWKSREGIKPIELYNAFGEVTELSIITATQDEVLTNTDFTGLSNKVTLIKQAANHDFTGDYRQKLINNIKATLS